MMDQQPLHRWTMNFQLNTKENKFVRILPSEPTLHLDSQLSIILFGGGGGKSNLTSSVKNAQASTTGCK